MAASDGKLTAEVLGEVETEDKVLILKRIHVAYQLKCKPEEVETVTRVHEMHHRFCPVYRSIERAIDITTEIKTDLG